MDWVRSHKPAVVLAAIAGGALVAWLAFGLFGIQTLFFDDKVDEAGPVFESGASLPEAETTTTTVIAGSSSPSTTEPPPTTEPPTTGAPPVEQVAAGMFVDRSHPARGNAIVLSDGTQTFLRFEDFETDNGPDLFVYLSRGATADSPEGALDDDFVNLGSLKGNVGDQNYEVPADVDVTEYSTVVVWCRQFSVAFGAADLA